LKLDPLIKIWDMGQTYAKLQVRQWFDDLIEFLDDEFQKIPDHWTGNTVRCNQGNMLKSVFAMFSLKMENEKSGGDGRSPAESV
jgi:hypothetical protein